MNNFCSIGSDFKGRYKKRAISSFVSATEKIMQEEGINKVTIRKVSDLAGYSSATIYSYFENIDHLIMFSSLKFLDEFIAAIPEYTKDCKKSLDVYKAVWKAFAHFAFKKPEIFQVMFFSKIDKKMDSFYTEYYCIYPINDEGYPKDIQGMLRGTNIYNRNELLMRQAVEDGFISKESKDEINEMSIFIFESILHRVHLGEISAEDAEVKFMNYLNRILDIK